MDLHGVVEGDRFVKRVGPQHFFVKYHGFGISLPIIRELKVRGVKTVEFHYEGKTKHVYAVSLEDFGQVWYNTIEDMQLICSTKKMQEVKQDA